MGIDIGHKSGQILSEKAGRPVLERPARKVRLFDSREALFQVGNDVVDVLGADGQADGVGLDPLIQQFLGGELGMGGGSGMDHQGLDIRDVGQQGEDLQMIDEL